METNATDVILDMHVLLLNRCKYYWSPSALIFYFCIQSHNISCRSSMWHS